MLTLVCGAPRSGSTLLYNSICSSKIFNEALTENHFIPNIIKLLKKQLFRNQKENFMHFQDNEDAINFYTSIINEYLNKLFNRYQVKNLCLKSIMFSSETNYILNLLPSAHLIFIVRDPKDIISSMLNVSKKQINLGIKPNYPRDMNALCAFINSHYEFVLSNESSQKHSNIIFIKYEDLILNTLEVLNLVFKNLSLDYTFKDIENLWDRAPKFLEPSQNPFHSDLWNKKPSSIKIGSYKNVLSSEETSLINNYCKKIITKFNY